MFSSFSIGRVFGIPIRVHVLWLVLPIWFALTAQYAPVLEVVNVVLLFGCVVLHEIGHSVVARAFKVEVIDIVLWPLGGFARMKDVPERSGVQALIALAGPAVNVVLALVTFAAALATGVKPRAEAPPSNALEFVGYALWWLAGMNALLMLNLIPAFPLDGGLVLRAFFGLFSDWLTATRRTVIAGKFVAALLIVLGVFTFSSIGMFFLILAFLIYVAGPRELFAVRMRHGDIPMPGMPGGPQSTEYHDQGGPRPPSASGDASGARRPNENPMGSVKGNFSPDDIAKIERYRGPLRPPPSDPE